MKNDSYTKFILTVIAVCLAINTLEKIDLIPTAHAATTETENNSNPNYAVVPVNEDGSINVTLKNSEVIDVNIKGINTYDELDVNVNLEKIGGYSTYGEIPIKVKE